MFSDDENDLSATDDAFASLHDVAGRRLRRGRLTVVDATNVHADSRRALLALAREDHVLAAALVLDVPEKLRQRRNASRADRRMGPHVVRHHVRDLKRSLRCLKDEGLRIVHALRSPEEADAAVVVRDRM